jgi:Ca2+-binding EF-hand superfamily protein
MGNLCQSAPEKAVSQVEIEHEIRVEQTSSRIIEALQKKLKEVGNDEHAMSLERILLRFEKKRAIMSRTKKAFNEFSEAGSIKTIDKLQLAINKVLGEEINLDMIKNVFEMSDLDMSRTIEFKEFLTALVVSMILEDQDEEEEFIKSQRLSEGDDIIATGDVVLDDINKKDSSKSITAVSEVSAASSGKASSVRSFPEGLPTTSLNMTSIEGVKQPVPKEGRRSSFKIEAISLSGSFTDKMPQVPKTPKEELFEMLSLIVTAYLSFDKTGAGYIQKKTVEQVLDSESESSTARPKHEGSGDHSVSHQRFKEMDWDGNGCVDFAEFVTTFSSWIFDDEDDVEE